jgi:hypothetical protein
MRSVADELSDWSGAHDDSRLADEAATWARRTAARVEDDPARHLLYEARRRAPRPGWPTALVVLAVVATLGGVIVWTSRRRHRAQEAEQQARAGVVS